MAGSDPAAPSAPWDTSWAAWQTRRHRPRPGGLARRLLLRWPIALALVLAVAVGAATDLTRAASPSGRLVDLRAYYQSLQTGLSSCTGGLHDALAALTAVLSGASSDRATAEGIALAGEHACTPVSNGDLFDMATTSPPRSLTGYGVGRATDRLYTWAFPQAALADSEIYLLLEHHRGPGSTAARQLVAQLSSMNTLAGQVLASFDTAAARLHGTLPPFTPAVAVTAPGVLLSSP